MVDRVISRRELLATVTASLALGTFGEGCGDGQGSVPGASANARGSGYYGRWVLCKPERIRADDGAPLVRLSACGGRALRSRVRCLA